jgi:hypothetical protein
MRNWLFGLPGRMMSMLFTLLFIFLAFSALGEFGISMCSSCFHLRTLVYSLSGSASHFLRDVLKTWYTFAVPLMDTSRYRIRPDTRHQIKGRKSQHIHPAVWRQHQSRKLWILPRRAREILCVCVCARARVVCLCVCVVCLCVRERGRVYIYIYIYSDSCLNSLAYMMAI